MYWFQKGADVSRVVDDEGYPTYSSMEQETVEHSVMKKFRDFEDFSDIEPEILIQRERHVSYLLRGLVRLSKSYECLDASRPWLCYWIVHSLALLDEPIPDELKSRICKFLAKCQSSTGGFGGGPDQIAHLAPTYAAVNCLCTLATEEAYAVINRERLLEFLWRMRQKDGSFTMHDGGEADTRSVYCAVSAVTLCGLTDNLGELFTDSPQWLVGCQTFEGGMGGCHGAEAHGGYTFCGYAALVILGHSKLIDSDRLLRWVVNRQMTLEGGFQGRTNKLVDGCYSFWQGGLLPLLHNTLSQEGGVEGKLIDAKHGWLYEQEALQHYLLLCCQNSFGGLIDKPGKSPDYYHTCYGLSGLSTAQHCPDGGIVNIGPKVNQLVTTHPAFNVVNGAVAKAIAHFKKVPFDG
ncbi:protein farnesyltransferase subunit beta-like [Clavelina lepadiformis]|uniref:protein farnesyltransferase subunit beta-like n=1 Tax=Clavelina lepadiformis TaxID=159417 RepID=UPI004040EC43